MHKTLSSNITADVAAVRAYTASEKGRRNRRELMVGRGYSFERAIGEAVVYVLANCHNGRLRCVPYERIRDVTDAVIIAELGHAREPEAVA